MHMAPDVNIVNEIDGVLLDGCTKCKSRIVLSVDCGEPGRLLLVCPRCGVTLHQENVSPCILRSLASSWNHGDNDGLILLRDHGHADANT